MINPSSQLAQYDVLQHRLHRGRSYQSERTDRVGLVLLRSTEHCQPWGHGGSQSAGEESQAPHTSHDKYIVFVAQSMASPVPPWYCRQLHRHRILCTSVTQQQTWHCRQFRRHRTLCTVHLSHNNRHDTVDSSADTELYVRYICHTTTDMINTELYVHLSHDNRHDTVDSSADTELYVHLPHDNHKMQMLEIYLLR